MKIIMSGPCGKIGPFVQCHAEEMELKLGIENVFLHIMEARIVKVPPKQKILHVVSNIVHSIAGTVSLLAKTVNALKRSGDATMKKTAQITTVITAMRITVTHVHGVRGKMKNAIAKVK